MDDTRIFFIHVMKTGGATFRQHLLSSFPKEEIYPFGAHERELKMANIKIDALLALPPDRRAEVRVYTGHFPFVVTELLGVPLVTLTILRDPVERTISYLKHCRRYHERHHDLPLEKIYEDGFSYPFWIHNHQTKVFAMTREDRLDTIMDVIDVDDRRLDIARANLEKVEVVGLNERFGEFLGEVSSRFGINVDGVNSRHVSRESWDVPKSFRRRIADDNARDIAFYEFACELVERRRSG